MPDPHPFRPVVTAAPTARRSVRVREVPVVIVGAGPAGLMTAISLARHGIECLLIERRPQLSGLPRATVVSMRSMELLRSWGLEDEVLAGGVDVEWSLLRCETLSGAATGSTLPLGFPTREQSAVLSPCAPACVPQDHLEPVLLHHLLAQPEARVELGVELVGLHHHSRGAEVTIRAADSGATRRVAAHYVVGADGAHSSVRAALDIPMHGEDQLRDSVTAVFRAPLWSVVGDRRHGVYSVTTPDAPANFYPAGPDDRWLYGMNTSPGADRPSEPTPDELARLMRLGSGVPDLQPRIERIGTFSFAAQMADRFRDGPTFLVGDAAHRVTPRGGTGMNAAIHDGYDLGWKLAWVLQGWADASLLDSYETERRPVVEHNLARSVDPSGSIRDAPEELQVDLGGRLTHRWLPSPSGQRSTLDVLGRGLTLLTGPAWARRDTRLDGRVPVTVHRLDHVAARALGIGRHGALLARPDGVPVGSWATGSDGWAGVDGPEPPLPTTATRRT